MSSSRQIVFVGADSASQPAISFGLAVPGLAAEDSDVSRDGS